MSSGNLLLKFKDVEFMLGPKAYISDPCYYRHLDWEGSVSTKSGIWQANAVHDNYGNFGTRVKSLLCWHKQASCHDVALSCSELLPFVVPVDSGQAGIFCEDFYPVDEFGSYNDDTTFYGRCCSVTLNHKSQMGTVFEHGVCSSSGFGDGSYVVYVERDFFGDIIALRMEFIQEEEESNEDAA